MELTRSIVSRLRQYIGDRRHAKRHKVRLTFTLSLASSAKSLNGARRINSLAGHTLDLSPTGLGLLVPDIHLGEYHLVGGNRSLNVKLELPSGPIEMRVTPIRYETLEEDENRTGYVIGVKIAEMTEEDRATFTAYISSLAGKA